MLKPKIRIKLAELEKRQNEVTKTLDISAQRFSNWVNGAAYPKLEEAFRLAKYLDCSIEDLWEYEEKCDQTGTDYLQSS
ncbi:helix-turn-helix transcriptional regulator [Halalkalibacter oceani]|uniref:Helix-turn-helix transcriptional regulator n=1 Tax=Halalkalibacter oceani TaxID=1653776 RepID=A0A9X2IPD9_9BACI|nr:helix-turn-helix transcriptional regulator [Halalkalibacter oceani]MCM3715924.1 helix-turn-helix transcriptional regulator [Halalkalibacter oceani]